MRNSSLKYSAPLPYFAASWTGTLCLLATACVGVQGGSDALTARFSGIATAVAVSPTAVTLTWPSQAGYKSYSVYSSVKDTPVITLTTGTTYTVLGLKPNSSYSFSVVGTASDGNQYGVGKQLQATTWSNFLGPVSASAIDSQSIGLLWNYNAGPLFNVYVSTSPTPTIVSGSPPTLISPQYTSSSQAGYAVSGLQASTTYYFMVAAKYSDGTDSYQVSQGASGLATADFINASGLEILPTITTTANLTNLVPPIFNISGAQTTFKTKFELFNSNGTKTLLGNLTGNGSLTSLIPLPVGVQNVIVTTTDLFTGYTAYFEFSGLIVNTSLPNNGLRVVSATTASALSPIPSITTSPISLGPFPIFTVSGGQPSYVTTLRNGTSVVGSITGNGTIKTSSSAPLPQGLNSLTATVAYNGQSTLISGINVRVKATDAQPVLSPVAANGGIGLQGFGQSMVVGDFNCDGRPDLAVSGPYGQTGGVWVYYGGASGLDFSAEPSANPNPGKPLYISGAGLTVGSRNGSPTGGPSNSFGVSLAVGNFNGDYSVTPTHPCSDLAIGAPSAGSPTNPSYNSGLLIVYYGAPTGLQTGALQTNSFACTDGSSSCQPMMYDFATVGVPYSSAASPFQLNYYPQMGYAIAAGDVDGDGYDDIVTTAPYGDPSISLGYSGILLLWRGTANGISPNFTPIAIPSSLLLNSTGPNVAASSGFGMQVAIGHFMTSPRPVTSPGIPTGAPADLAVSFLQLGALSPGVTSPTGQTGLVVIPGQATTPYFDTTSTNSFAYILPPSCNNSLLPAGWTTYFGYGCAVQPQSLVSADINQDGYDDLIFANASAGTPGGGKGAVYVYFGMNGKVALNNEGKQSVFASPGNTCTDPTSNPACLPQVFYRSDSNSFGSSVGILGDVNSDGYPDVGIGALAQTVGPGTYAGKAYGFRGSIGGLIPNPPIVINPAKGANSFFGSSIIGADFAHSNGFAALQNGVHTFSQLAVGAVGESPANRVASVVTTGSGPLGSQGHGTVSFYTNTSGLPFTLTTPTAVLAPDNALPTGINSDSAVIAGDINGDGYGDVVIPIKLPGPFSYATSGYGFVLPSIQWGFVIYYGSPTGFITTHTVGGVIGVIQPSYNPLRVTDPLLVTNSLLNGGSGFNDPNFSANVGAPGDMNGDGFADVYVSDNLQSVLFYGSPTGLIVSPAPQKIAYTSAARPNLDPTILTTWGPGLYLNAAGDFNGDGYSDILSGNLVIYGSKWGPVTGGNLTGPGTTPDTYAAFPNCLTVAGNSYCTPLYLDPASIVPAGGGNRVCGYASGGDMDGDGTDDLVASACLDNRFTPATDPSGHAGTITIFYGSKTNGIHPSVQVNLQIDPIAVTRVLGGTWDPPHSAYFATFAKGYDINGDGLGDIVLDSSIEGTAYVIYGVPGSGTSPTLNSGAYINQGMCAGNTYPCTVHVSETASATYSPNQVLSVNAANPSSCNPALRACNVMRWQLPDTYCPYNQQGLLGLGDITGDTYGDVVLSRGCATGQQPAGTGTFFLYSGSASGLQVAGTPTYKPNCIAGICDPTQFDVPANISQNPGSVLMKWNTNSNQNPSDVDGDGKRDFLISSPLLNSADLSGNINGTGIGGFFLFH